MASFLEVVRTQGAREVVEGYRRAGIDYVRSSDWSAGNSLWAGDVDAPRAARLEDLYLVLALALVLSLLRETLIQAVTRPALLFCFGRPTTVEERDRWGEQITRVAFQFVIAVLTLVSCRPLR